MKLLARFLLACCAVLACSAETPAERLVRATISMDDKVIPKGTTTDDGRTDADGVWEYLKSMRFQGTSALTKKRFPVRHGILGRVLGDTKVHEWLFAQR